MYDCEAQGCSINETWKKIKQIKKHFIINNLIIKGNTPYPILILEVGLPPVESKGLIRYPLYKYKLPNMKRERLPITTSNNESHSRIKRGQTRDASFLAPLLGVVNEDALLNINTIDSIIVTNFKEKLWCYKQIENKKMLVYNKEAIDPKLKDRTYLSIFASVEKKINIAKIITNSHDLHTEIGRCTRLETSQEARIYKVCDSNKVKNEKHFLFQVRILHEGQILFSKHL